MGVGPIFCQMTTNEKFDGSVEFGMSNFLRWDISFLFTEFYTNLEGPIKEVELIQNWLSIHEVVDVICIGQVKWIS